MSTPLPAKPRSLLRRYLAAGYALFIIYASLSPFSGWREQGFGFAEVLASPFVQTYTAFDAMSNLLAYLPFGLLLALTLRVHFDALKSVLGATLGGLLLSVAMEYLQTWLPSRISSNSDILSNTTGMLIGALLAVTIVRQAWFAHVTEWRIGLFRQGAGVDFGLALMMLWMFAQINPSLPMLGNVFITEPAYGLSMRMPDEPFSLWESMAVSLNMMMAGLLLLTLLRVRRHAVVGVVLMLCTVALAKFVAAALLLKSWALLLWLNGEAMLGIVVGLLVMAAIGGVSRVWLFRALVLVALIYLVLVHWVLDSGAQSATMRLYHWRYGHLRNYVGLSQTVSSLFPLLLGGYLWWTRATRHQEEVKE
ncbi:MAG: VanZ family protein [Nitrosomonadales bacterium]|nr:VanZ family protein [Nitrosomonadales bacterium]